jgi:hypothetical protein
MKHIAFMLLVGLCASFLGACKKGTGSDVVTPVVDPREKLIGVYSVSGNIVISLNSAPLEPEGTSGTITVAKGTASNQILVTTDFPDFKEQLTADLTKNDFVVTDKKTETIRVNGTVRTGPLTASGTFTDKGEMTFVSSTEAAGNIVFKKVRSVTGAKKSQ